MPTDTVAPRVIAYTAIGLIAGVFAGFFGVGGGITSGSETIDEIHEVGVKADALLRVLGATPNLFLSAE